MRYAVQQGLTENNPALHLEGVTAPPVKNYYPALPLERLPEFSSLCHRSKWIQAAPLPGYEFYVHVQYGFDIIRDCHVDKKQAYWIVHRRIALLTAASLLQKRLWKENSP